MQPAEKSQPSGPVAADFPAQPEAAPQSAQNPAEPQADAQTPLLAQDQVAKLQKILRSMDDGQLQSVLSAIEPNVLRLCLHAIFGPQSSEQSAPAAPPQNHEDFGPDLSAHAKKLAKTIAESSPKPHPQAETSPAAKAKSGGVSVQGRLNPRRSTQNNAKIYCPSDEISFDCLILDKSKTGALVFLDHAGEIPDTFDLYDIDDHKSDEEFIHLPHKKCKAVWRKRNKMGVTFVS
ncbi:MAG: hypothetical protein GY948_04630 [Alphaproteobacteria bacterium]|nr:hypothetical protein [Alphaproteobacteria bacterium]